MNELGSESRLSEDEELSLVEETVHHTVQMVTDHHDVMAEN